MKLSKFKFIKKSGTFPFEKSHAEVSVQTGYLWWKKETKALICKDGISWFFESDGKFTPGSQAEDLARAYEATNEIKL